MSTAKRMALLALAIAPAGCEFIHPPTNVELMESVVVHAVLAAGSQEVSVLLTLVGPEPEPRLGEQPSIEAGIEPVSGAEVRLISGADTVQLEEAPAGFRACYVGFGNPYGSDSTRVADKGCYAARVPGGVRAGVSYALRIRLPDGRTIDGQAAPPPVPEVLSPEPYTRIVGDPAGGYDGWARVRVRFRAPAEMAGVGLVVQATDAFLGGERVEDGQCTVYAPPLVISAENTDSIAVPIHGFGCLRGQGSARQPFRPDSLHARLHVTAYDAAFMRYLEAVQGRQTSPEAAAQGISGALGLFAGETTAKRVITLLPAP